jgi:hypothetical protein
MTGAEFEVDVRHGRGPGDPEGDESVTDPERQGPGEAGREGA